ncbi:MAG: hypothetical protein QOI19_13 [Thermoleophilaceae bacterium]|nr:hypothetical protein [Thermoleophilaceae bacterium]
MQIKTKWVRVAPIAVLLAALAVIAGCGGGSGSSTDARALIDKAFKQPISSADMTLNIEAKVNGVAQLQQPISLKVAGPFQSNGKGKLPSFNWQVSVSGGGQAFSGGVVSTGQNAFVNFQGTNYEVGAAKVAQFNQQLGTSGSKRSLKDFGIDPQAWVKDPTEQGSDNVNGVDTTHVHASVDIGRMFSDFNKTIQKAGQMGTPAAPQQLSADTIKKIQDIVKNPKVDIYVGKSDSKIRRLSVAVDFQIPSDQRSKFQGAEGGTLTFSIDFAKVGQPQTITAPANARPISELQQQLGGLGGGLGGLGGSGSSGGAGGSGGSAGAGGTNPTPAQFEKYSKCLQSADPSNTAAIQKCAQLLK